MRTKQSTSFDTHTRKLNYAFGISRRILLEQINVSLCPTVVFGSKHRFGKVIYVYAFITFGTLGIFMILLLLCILLTFKTKHNNVHIFQHVYYCYIFLMLFFVSVFFERLFPSSYLLGFSVFQRVSCSFIPKSIHQPHSTVVIQLLYFVIPYTHNSM